MLVPPSPGHDHRHLLPKQQEVRLVRGEAKHDEVRVQAVEDVSQAGGPVGMGDRGIFGVVERLRLANVVHHLVLSLSRHVRPAHDHVAPVLPDRIRLLLVLDPLSHGKPQLQHEVGPGRDAVGIERVPLRQGPVPSQDRGRQLLGLLRGAESARALLIHFGAGRHPVDGEVEHLPRLHDFVQSINVAENLFEHLRLVENGDLLLVVAVSARVDDAVHVEVEVIDGRDGRGRPETTVEDVRILICQPAEHFRDAEEGC
mmetsp:Transcript_39618/g.84508  ORF Transcript_39618/g.84508 Transcript_39618/m.84508 type:complete len:257 (-) Transcript_39618:339-1109(-)